MNQSAFPLDAEELRILRQLIAAVKAFQAPRGDTTGDFAEVFRWLAEYQRFLTEQRHAQPPARGAPTLKKTRTRPNSHSKALPRRAR
jgi:hypothetical protein